jgi:hypothetical protein
MLAWEPLGPGRKCVALFNCVQCQMLPIGVKIAAQGDVKAEQNFADFLVRPSHKILLYPVQALTFLSISKHSSP